jgi:phage gp36-like protein
VIFAIIFGFVVIKNYNVKKNISPLSNQKVVETKIKKKHKESKDEVIDSNALQDTTNYLDKYMFKKKSNPFKSDQ